MRIVVLFAAIVSMTLAADVMKNIDFLACGYDIYMGNPHPTSAGSDPGFRGSIFAFDFDKQQTTGDRRWEIPDNMDFRMDYGCELSYHSTEVTGMQSYYRLLQEDAFGTGKDSSGSFTGSFDYKRVKNDTYNQHHLYTSSQAMCSVYFGQLNTFALPGPHYIFMKTLEALPLTYDKETYLKFLQFYGTHHVGKVKMGATYGFENEFTEDAWKHLLELDIDIGFAASASSNSASGNGSTQTNATKRIVQEFDKKRTNTYIFTLGSHPPSDGKSETWAQKAAEEPMPISYTLKPISELFTSNFLPNVSNLDQIKKNIDKAVTDYCQELVKQGKVDTCDPPGPDPKPPIIKNACRFCQHRCGNSYPLDHGGLAVDRNWHRWFETYEDLCLDNTYGTNDGHNIRLCCQEEKKKISEGSCKYCSKCGDEYNITTGILMNNTNWQGWIASYGSNCLGDPSPRAKTGDAMYFCCKPDPVCAFCSTCGGRWPDETGVMSRKYNWPEFFQQYDRQCSGEIGHHDYSNLDGVKLCCINGASDKNRQQKKSL